MPTSPDASGSELDHRPPLLAVAAWLGAWLGTGLSPAAALVVLAAAAVASTLLRRRRLITAIGVTFACCTALAALQSWAAHANALADLAAEEAVVVAEFEIGQGRLSDASPGGPVWIATARMVAVEGRGQAWLSGVEMRVSATGTLLQTWAAAPVGSIVRATVRLGPADPTDRASAWGSLRSPPVPLSGPGPIDAAVNHVREGLRTAVAGLPADPRGLLPGLVLGDTSQMPSALVDDFKTAGLTHLTAVSGANLMLLLAAVFWIAGRLGVLGWWRRGLALATVAAFVVLCRGEPSVLRAAAMGLVGLAALGWAGAGQGLRYLSWAIVGLVMFDPWLSRSVGFALSVLASAGIIWWARRWAKVLSGWMPSWLAEAIAVPVAAQLATQPVVTAISGQVSVVGVLANLLAAPLVGPATVLGFAAAGASVLVAPVAVALGWAGGGFAQVLCWLARASAGLPGAAIAWPISPIGLALLVVGCVVISLAAPLLWARPWLAAAVAGALLLALVRAPGIPGWPPPNWLVVSCDVGQGDATVLRAGPHEAVVVDTGPDPGPVDRCLSQLEVRQVPWLILTHLHADHAGGVAGVAKGRRIDRLAYSGVETPTQNWQEVVTALPQVPRLAVGRGSVLAAGQVQVEVVSRRPLLSVGVDEQDSAEENDSSLVMRVRLDGVDLILAGDVEPAGQEAALATGADLRAQVLLVPHHGSARQSEAFLRAVGPAVALISVGADNDYGHPAARTVGTVAATGARLFRTDRFGAIAISAGSGGLLVTTQRTP
jgi:ComEC/Rec2-related protein